MSLFFIFMLTLYYKNVIITYNKNIKVGKEQ